MAQFARLMWFAAGLRAGIEEETIHREATDGRVADLDKEQDDLKQWISSHCVYKP